MLVGLFGSEQQATDRCSEFSQKNVKIYGNIHVLWHIMIQRGDTNDDT